MRKNDRTPKDEMTTVLLRQEVKTLRAKLQRYESRLQAHDDAEILYRSVVNNIGIGIAVINPEMRILSLNRQMKKWFPRIRVSEKPVCYRAFNIPPREEICSYCPTCKTLRDGKIHHAVTETPAGGKVLRYRIISTAVRGPDGEVAAAIEMVDDISKKKELEDLLAQERETFFSILQKAPYGVVLMDNEGRYLYVNREFVAITGYSMEDVPTGPDWFEKAYPDEEYRSQVVAAWRGDLARRGITRVFAVTCKDGSVKDIEFRPTTVDKGRSIVMLSDITKRRQAEEAIRRSRDELEKMVADRTEELVKANRALREEIGQRREAESEILKLNEELRRSLSNVKVVNRDLELLNYSISHDLRSPVMAIEGFSKNLLEKRRDNLGSKELQFLSMIYYSAVQMRELINGLISFFKVGRSSIHYKPLSIYELILEVFEQLKTVHGGRKIELHLNPLPVAFGDRVMIRQVITNILDNAIKYTKNREISHIEVGGKEGDVTHVYFVRDNGVGFPMEKAGKLFHVFERLHSPQEYDGIGIGLAVVRKIVQGHGGELWAESSPDQGSTFYFSLPARPSNPTP